MSLLRYFSRSNLLINNPNVPKVYFFKDSIHGSINFDPDNYWLYDVVNTYEFWRLHNLRQMSFVYLNFPSATHTRFEHSLGAYELCHRFIKFFIEKNYLNKDKKEDRIAINIALATALLHDVGHGPLSHVFEGISPKFKHEKMTIRIIKSKETKINSILKKKSIEDGLTENFYEDEISKVLNKTSKYKWIVGLISSDFDVDRLDYLMRDSLHSGVLDGNSIDVDLFIKWSCIKDGQLVFQKKIKNGLFHFLHYRTLMYRDLYENSVSNFIEKLFIIACEVVNEKGNMGKFSWIFNSLPEEWNLEDFLNLNDDVLIHFIKNSLQKQFSHEESRYLLGWIFGIWLDEKGNYCEHPEIKMVKSRLMGMIESRNFKSKINDEVVAVNFLDISTGEVSKCKLCVKCECFNVEG